MNIIGILKAKFRGNKPRLSLVNTIVFNFKTLPFKTAIKLPMHLYGKWNFRALKGEVVLDSNSKHCGALRLGYDTAGYFSSYMNTIALAKGSKFVLHEGARVGQGVQICLYPNAYFEMGKESSINDNVKIICSKKIVIGERTDITWECQVSDFNSHFIVDTNTNSIATIYKPVLLGDYCWVCNQTTIMPGTVLPNRTIVASKSLLNRDYVKLGIPERSLIGGVPAKLIKTGVFRIYNRNNENFLKRFFCENSNAEVFEGFDISNFEE